MANFAVSDPPSRFVRAIGAQFRHSLQVPFVDPLERYLHTRADRRALAQLREAHPEEYARYYDAEAKVVRELVSEEGLEVTKQKFKTGPRPDSPVKMRRVGGCVICAMEKHKKEHGEREEPKDLEVPKVPKVPKERKARVPRRVPREPERVLREPERERAPEPVSQEPAQEPVASTPAHEQLETPVSEQVTSATRGGYFPENPKPATENEQSEGPKLELVDEDPFAEPCDAGDVCEWNGPPACWTDGTVLLHPFDGGEPMVACPEHEKQIRRKLRIPERVATAGS